MRKLIAIGMIISVLALFVSVAGAVTVTKPVFVGSVTQKQIDQAGFTTTKGEVEALGQATGVVTDGHVTTPASVDISSTNLGSAGPLTLGEGEHAVQATGGIVSQDTTVKAQGEVPSASSEQEATIHAGTSCSSVGGCPITPI